jgi:hypothetical protein
MPGNCVLFSLFSSNNGLPDFPGIGLKTFFSLLRLLFLLAANGHIFFKQRVILFSGNLAKKNLFFLFRLLSLLATNEH